jgi:peptide/nickel transport system permease protein
LKGAHVVTSFALFLTRRLLGIAVLVWVVTLAAFGLFRAGVPSPAADAQINAQLGPGEPATWQYFHYLLRLLHGNLGESLTVGLPVSTVLWRALPPTLSLMIGGMILWLITGVLAGTVSALRPGSWADRTVTGAVLAAAAVPTFLLALLLLNLSTYLAVTGNLWMQTGYVPITQSPGQWLGRIPLVARFDDTGRWWYGGRTAIVRGPVPATLGTGGVVRLHLEWIAC